MQDEAVFNEYHSFLHTLYKENIIQGFRIDHIDGLNDPAAYIQRLRSLFGDTCYIIAEKILELKETMPESWPLQGTSGYEFLAYVNQLFTDRKGAKQLVEFYKTLVPQLPAYKQLVVDNKKMMLENFMAGEWENLTNFFMELELGSYFEKEGLRQALGALLVSLPVYRIYPDDLPLTGQELVIMAEAIHKAKHLSPSSVSELDYINELLVSPPRDLKDDTIKFLKRMMQFTGPLTAKGVEDTTFYIYNPLISHDEVGDSPSTMGITIREFHGRMVARQQTTPISLNATATHDTKRGEDVRIRLNILSEIPDEWMRVVQEWFSANKECHALVNEQPAPSVNDEYFIYQSILGGFPENFQPTEHWVSRLKEYLIKALREAKVNSSWESPNEAYENACTRFIDRIVSDEKQFLPGLLRFLKTILTYANTNALGQTLIKNTAPGIPDTYQGCELWDLSYVDPDNRRPVDYDIRKKYLNQIREKENETSAVFFSYLSDHRDLGVEKLFVTWRALNFRRRYSDIFIRGEYVPLTVSGSHPVACAYARVLDDQWVLVIIPLALATKHQWTDESVMLPQGMPGVLTNIFTRKKINVGEYLSLRETLLEFPLGFLTSVEYSE
jgi:(1->4)-alpha-D-glucan 1-alpha-D-glucosylmutase